MPMRVLIPIAALVSAVAVAAPFTRDAPGVSVGIITDGWFSDPGDGGQPELTHLAVLTPADLCDPATAFPGAADGRRRAYLLPWPEQDDETCWIAGLVRLAGSASGAGHAYLIGDPAASASDPEAFAFLLKRSAVTIRAADPSAVIVAGPLAEEGAWSARVAGLAIKPYLDAVSTSDGRIQSALEVTAGLFPGTPVWSVERTTPGAADPPALIRAARALAAGAEVSFVHGKDAVDARALAGLAASAPANARPSFSPTVRAVSGSGPVLELIGNVGERLLVMPASSRVSSLRIGTPPPGSVESIDPVGGARRSLRLRTPGGIPTVSVAAAEAPVLLAIYPAADLNLEELEIANPRPGLTAEEIIALEREVRARQELALQHFTAEARVAYHFTIANLGESVDVVTRNDAFGRGEAVEYRQTAMFINGSRWRGDPPAFPFIAPEKVKQVPLALSLREGYDYRLEGEETVNGRPCYRISFAPGGEAEGAFRGTVWIDRETFFRVRMDLVRLAPTQPVTSDVLTQWYEPVETEQGTFRLITRMEGQMVFSALGTNAVVDRKVDFEGFRFNESSFEKERNEALASKDPMYRDSLEGGLVALVPGEDGSRFEMSATTKSNTLLLMGWNGSLDGEFSIPLAGINWFDLDWRGRGIQMDVAWAGPFLASSITWPRLGSGWEPSLQGWLTAIPEADRYVDENGNKDDEDLERLDERIQGFMRHGLGPYFTFSFEPSLAFLRVSRRDNRTREDYVLPPETAIVGAAVRFDFLRRGYHLSLWADAEHRLDWGPFGLPEDITPESEFLDTPMRWGLRFNKNWHSRRMDRFGIDVDLYDGRDLDRFSAFQRLDFSPIDLRGYDGTGIRFHRGVTGSLRYAWRMIGNLRWEVIVGGGVFRNPVDFDDVWHNAYGVGYGVSFPGPWGTLFRIRGSYGIDSSLPVGGAEGSTRVAVFKTFDGWWPWDRRNKKKASSPTDLD